MYERNYRLRSPSPRRWRVSPPPVRFRDRGYSKPRCRDSMNTKDERRGGSYLRRDYDRRYERGDKDYGGRSGPEDRDYERCYDRGDRDYERNYERGSRDHRRNFDREEDKRYDGRLDYGGARVSEFDGGNKDRYREGNTDATRSSIYQSISDAGYSGRVLRYGEGMLQENSTSSKFQWDHLLNEPKKSEGIKESTHHGTNGSGINAELDYGYQRSRHFDEGGARVPLDRKTAAMEAETGRDYSSSSYQMDAGGLHKCSSHVDAVGGFITLPSNFSNSILRKDEEFHFPHKPRLVDGPLMEGQLAREANLLPYSRADVDFMASSSRSKAFGAGSDGSFKDDSLGSLIPSDGLKFCSGVSNSYFGYDDYRAKQAMSPVEGRGTLDDFKSYSRSYVDAAGGRSSKFSNPGVCQSERSVVVTRPVEFYEKMESIGERYDHQDMSRVDMLDSTNNKLDGSSPHGYLTRNRFWDPTTALGQSSSSYYDTHELSYASTQNVQNQDLGCPRTLHERDFYDGHSRSSIPGGLHYDYRLVRSSWSPEKGTDRLSPRTFEPNLSNSNGQSRQELLSVDIGFPRSSKMSRQSYDTDKQANEHDSMVYDRGSTGETWRNNIDSITSSKKFKLKNSKNGKTKKISSLLEHQKLSSSFPSYSGKPLRFGNCDIKKRLGPGPQKAHVLERLTRKFKPSLRKRLGPSPQKSHFTPPPWVRHLKAPQFPGYEDASNRSNLHQGEETQEYSGTATKSEPPENSEEFRQLMFNAFFKFVKQLNETPAKRKKYKEQGEAGNLKCIICGRSVLYIMNCLFIGGEVCCSVFD